MNQVDYLIRDMQCMLAIEAFKTLNSVPAWLEAHQTLYDSIQIRPKGLPPLTDATFGGDTYENIEKFSYLYQTVRKLF